jgi:hypothetical protein
MPNYQEMTRLKDEFAMASQLRPATAEHYVAWLEEYLDKGRDIANLSLADFSKEKFFTVSADAQLPPLENGLSLNIIVPPGVRLDASAKGDCNVYFTDAGEMAGEAKIMVWSEMLDMLIGDGYPLARLVDGQGLATCTRIAIINSIVGKDARSNDFYETFANEAWLETIAARLKKMQALDVDGIMRDFMKLKKDTPIDAVSQRVIDGQAQAALKTLQILKYKLDPASQEPIAAFGKRAKLKAPEEPNIELESRMQINPPLRLKDPASQP